MANIYQDDVGVVVKLHLGIDTTSATTREIRVQKPDSTTVVWTASQLGTSEITYNTIVGDLDQSGEYIIQAYIDMPSFTGLGDSATMMVSAAFA